jgi:molecular chaperone GrpE (heat shock protein)
MMRMPSNEYEEGVIVQEVAPGYRLKDKVLRHARVIVSQGKPEEGKES